MRVTGWSNGQPLPTGAGYGVRLSDHDRDDHFDHGWHQVVVILDEGESVSVPLSKSFWRSCPELRSAAIGRWLLRLPSPRPMAAGAASCPDAGPGCGQPVSTPGAVRIRFDGQLPRPGRRRDSAMSDEPPPLLSTLVLVRCSYRTPRLASVTCQLPPQPGCSGGRAIYARLACSELGGSFMPEKI